MLTHRGDTKIKANLKKVAELEEKYCLILDQNHSFMVQIEKLQGEKARKDKALKNLMELIDDCIKEKQCTSIIKQHYTYKEAKAALSEKGRCL